jgi:hypothetical protein
VIGLLPYNHPRQEARRRRERMRISIIITAPPGATGSGEFVLNPEWVERKRSAVQLENDVEDIFKEAGVHEWPTHR